MSKKKKKAWAENGLEDWDSYMAAKKEKLEDQFQEEAKKEFADATSLFSGLAIFVNGYTNPCADELKRLMMAHGGIYHHYMRTGVTTHIIASNLPYTKIVAYRKSQNPLPICKPEWITESLTAGRLLDWRPYVLYSNSTITQPQIKFSSNTTCADSFVTKEPEERKNSCAVAKEIKETLEAGASSGPAVAETSARVPPANGKSFGTVALSTKNSEFLSEFYNNSRLHHISTMGATFKDYVNELRTRNDGTFPGLERLRGRKQPGVPRSRKILNESDSEDDLFESSLTDTKKNTKSCPVIMHIDMDCFFVSVGLRNRPELKGLPIAVTHAKGNKQTPRNNSENNDSDEDYGSMSEIASCSYEARNAGVKNGMFLGPALKLCPGLKTIKYDFEGYKEVSYALYDTVASYTLLIEAVSCDEMYADITTIIDQSGLTPLEFATIIRNEIKEKTRCPVSTGFGSNKLQARLATRKAKPDGQFFMEEGRFKDHIGSMVVRDLPGVGYSTMQLLHKLNVRTCSDLYKIALDVLQKEFGKKTGEMLYNMCRGIDHSKLTVEHVRKSVSAEVNYGIRFENASEAEDFLRKLSQEVSTRLKKANSTGRSLTLKLMVRAKDAPKETLKFMGHGICDNFTKTKNMIAPIDDPVIITREVLSLWNQLQQPFDDIRGIGIQISRLESSRTRTGSLIHFINKSKQPEKIVDTEIQTNSSSVNNERKATIRIEKTFKTNPEPGGAGLKAFLVPKSKIRQEKRDFEKFEASAKENEREEIDEGILAELPDEIRREILESRESRNEKPSTSFDPEKIKNHIYRELPRSINEIQFDPASSSSDGLSPMSNYDESVLMELPEDIRNEIIGRKVSSDLGRKKMSSSRQTQQENYFKHAKSCANRSSKAKMPPIEEIDMSVLIELPEDIRNEIIDEYKAKKKESRRENTTELARKEERKVSAVEEKMDRRSTKPEVQEDANVSFSQIDPDFLAALSEDMKNDVEMYCMVKKKEKMKKLSAGHTMANILMAKNRNPTKLGKKSSRQQKSKFKPTSKVKSTNDRKKVQVPSDVGTNYEKSTDRIGGRFLDSEFNPNTKISGSLEQREEIISHHSSFTGNKAKTEEQEMLTTLVNYLFTLPLKQVKNQVQTWISNSDDVNEIDLLSLATFLSMLPKKKRLEELHILLKTMHRCITKTGSCVWHETYRRTVCHVQRYMRIEYNSKMMLPTMSCDRCDCETKSDSSTRGNISEFNK